MESSAHERADCCLLVFADGVARGLCRRVVTGKTMSSLRESGLQSWKPKAPFQEAWASGRPRGRASQSPAATSTGRGGKRDVWKRKGRSNILPRQKNAHISIEKRGVVLPISVQPSLLAT